MINSRTLAGYALGVAMATPAAAGNVDLQYGAYGSPSSTLVAHGVIPFLETAKEASGGTISYTLHAGGALVGTSTMLPGIRDGLVDGGQLLAVYFPSELPTINLAMGLGPSLDSHPVAIGAAITDFALTACDECIDEFEQWNVQFLGGYSTSPYSLLCTAPHRSLVDLAGKRVRAAGVWGRLADRLGMIPVNLTIGDTYEGLQRGQLDCTFGAPGWLESFSMADVAPNVILLNFGLSFSGPITNVSSSTWAALDDDQKNALKAGAALAVVRATQAYIDEDDAVLSQAPDRGWTVVEPEPEVLAALDGFSDEMRQFIIDRAVERGQNNAEEIVDRFLRVLEKWEAKIASADGDEEVIVRMLEEEVYSHLE